MNGNPVPPVLAEASVSVSGAVFWWALVVIVLLAVVVAWGQSTARRIHQLNVRTDLAWRSLEAALDHRAGIARTIPAGTPGAGGIEVLARASDVVERVERAAFESRLTKALGAVDRDALPRGLAEAIVDADARVVLARRFYNDSVRDTRALRSRGAVRMMRLAGTAAMPAYFEMAESDIPL